MSPETQSTHTEAWFWNPESGPSGRLGMTVKIWYSSPIRKLQVAVLAETRGAGPKNNQRLNRKSGLMSFKEMQACSFLRGLFSSNERHLFGPPKLV
jgi:hypothetical protein